MPDVILLSADSTSKDGRKKGGHDVYPAFLLEKDLAAYNIESQYLGTKQ